MVKNLPSSSGWHQAYAKPMPSSMDHKTRQTDMRIVGRRRVLRAGREI